MLQSEELAKKSSSGPMGWGIVLTVVGSIIFAIAFPLSLGYDSSWAPIIFTLLAGIALLVGAILMAVAITRFLGKVDDAHRHLVTWVSGEVDPHITRPRPVQP